MTPYLFVLAFLVFIIGTVSPIVFALVYEVLLKKFTFSLSLRKSKFLKLAILFTDCNPRCALSKACFFFGLFSIIVSACLMLLIGFESDKTRDLGLFVGLWASTLFGLANFFKN